jgi:hypothetical protein
MTRFAGMRHYLRVHEPRRRTVINSPVFDGATRNPVRQAGRDALIAFMASIAQAQAETTKEVL